MMDAATILASIALALSALLPFGVAAQSLTDYAENKIVDALMRGNRGRVGDLT